MTEKGSIACSNQGATAETSGALRDSAPESAHAAGDSQATESPQAAETTQAPISPRAAQRARIALFALLALLWLALDQATKAHFNGAYHAGQVISDPIAGIFRFHLVYNTGGAWSILEGATWPLAAFSLAVCAALVAYLVATGKRAAAAQALGARGLLYAETAGVALVVAGGVGNAIDRLALGYVVDFIEPTFISFPIFNVADIGVTCGIVVFFVAFALLDQRIAKGQGELR